MASVNSDFIEFDIIIRSPGLKDKSSNTISGDYYPNPGDISYCNTVLSSMGITCFKTNFGLCCKAKKEVIETVFSAEVAEKIKGLKPVYMFTQNPKPPGEIKDFIEQITFPEKPDYF